MKKLSAWVQYLARIAWLPFVLTLAGYIVYFLTAYNIAHTKTSFLDEGHYLVKGYLFATGKYVPYQDYGPWTNHMPFIFLIQGYIQKWFGPGLATARYFMIILGLTTLTAMYLLAKRWGGRWWAVAVIWAMALNPAEIKFHTLAISEGVIAPMMAWMFFFILGARRPLWQLIVGGLLAGVMAMTRLNMYYVLPLITLYVLWERGWKMALITALAGGLVIIYGHWLYWPNILKLWAKWLPSIPFFKAFIVPPAAFGLPIPATEAPTAASIFLYIWLTFRAHFVALLSVFISALLWPSRKGKKLTARERAALFLGLFVLLMLFEHARASFFGGWCVSCILLYSAYFDYLGLIVLVMSFRFLQKELSRWKQYIIYVGSMIIVLGIGYTNYEDVNSSFAKLFIGRFKDSYLWNLLTGISHVNALYLFRVVFTVGVSLLVIALAAASVWAARKYIKQNQLSAARGAYFLLIGLLIAGFVLSPTKVLGKGNDFFDCDGSDVLQSYAEVGAYLRTVIPAGSQIYWDGRIGALLLYLPDVKLYPPQINQSHSFYYGGVSDIMYRNSYWTDVLAKQWMKEADFILLEKGEKLAFEVRMVEGKDFRFLGQTRKVEKCRWQSIIEIYQYIK